MKFLLSPQPRHLKLKEKQEPNVLLLERKKDCRNGFFPHQSFWYFCVSCEQVAEYQIADEQACSVVSR